MLTGTFFLGGDEQSQPKLLCSHAHLGLDGRLEDCLEVRVVMQEC